MGTNISQGAGVCNTSRRGTLLFLRNFIFIFFWLNGALYAPYSGEQQVQKIWRSLLITKWPRLGPWIY